MKEQSEHLQVCPYGVTKHTAQTNLGAFLSRLGRWVVLEMSTILPYTVEPGNKELFGHPEIVP